MVLENQSILGTLKCMENQSISRIKFVDPSSNVKTHITNKNSKFTMTYKLSTKLHKKVSHINISCFFKYIYMQTTHTHTRKTKSNCMYEVTIYFTNQLNGTHWQICQTKVQHPVSLELHSPPNHIFRELSFNEDILSILTTSFAAALSDPIQ